MVNVGPLTAEIGSGVLGTPTNCNGFCVLAALLHGILVVGVSHICGVEQRAPPMFGRATIRLGIGPHSSLNEPLDPFPFFGWLLNKKAARVKLIYC